MKLSSNIVIRNKYTQKGRGKAKNWGYNAKHAKPGPCVVVKS